MSPESRLRHVLAAVTLGDRLVHPGHDGVDLGLRLLEGDAVA